LEEESAAFNAGEKHRRILRGSSSPAANSFSESLPGSYHEPLCVNVLTVTAR